ncbi:MAG TPA: 2-hydroxyglutaryl-CoA dehydratase, partial [Clostridiales bacterium]|nr:2-hydroxyglutaryl-CoA dehydratase [Clostridiales bacterium]
QGGTFLNDAILRSFEMEIGRDVTRPAISGLMGAYGAALHAQSNTEGESTLISREELETFSHNTNSVKCGMCTNHCSLTVSVFPGGRRFISGNRCERPLGGGDKLKLPNLYEYKLNRLQEYREKSVKGGERIGIPFGLNLFELLPFWHTMLTRMGFEVVLSDVSTRALYAAGQNSIPSDTVCYPAKLMHGHIENLLSKGVDSIFYPCMTYNLDEKRTVNCYNCPVVAYYPELLSANMNHLKDVDFMMPYFEPGRQKDFIKSATAFFTKKYPHLKKRAVKEAILAAYDELERYYQDIADAGARAIAYAEEHGLDIAVIAGRPYHIDPEINHGIDRLIQSYGMVIVSEDAVAPLGDMPVVNVLNQWTYHSRMYAAANWAANRPDAQLVQLVSFGCGIDAITTDEMRAITEEKGKIYTQLKIDEINNLGAAKIRIRSMIAAVEEGRKNVRKS